MLWPLAVVIILILVLALSEFRKYGIVIVSLFAIFIFFIWQYVDYEEKRSKERISPSDLSFESVKLNQTFNGYEFTGRIINNSDKYTLSGIQMKLEFKDCEKTDNGGCVVIAEENKFIYIKIPPKQARDFKENFYPYPDLKIRGKLIWDYTVNFAKAE